MPFETCPKCSGKGWIVCPVCQGKREKIGIVSITPCQNCDGTGRVKCPMPGCQEGYIRLHDKR